MGAFVVYLIKSALLVSLLVSLFMLLMSRETFHKANRFFMLSIMALAVVLPLVNVGIDSPLGNLFARVEGSFAGQSVVATEEVDDKQLLSAVDIEEATLMLPMDIREDGAMQKSVVENTPWWVNALQLIYLLGVALLIIRQLAMYIQIARLIARSRVADATRYGYTGIRLKVHNGKEKPFSWFGWVVMSEDDLNYGAREILTHEAAHVHAGHSLDIVLADAVIMLQWFNPLAWIMKNCLKDIHEFEADEAVIESGVNAKQYQLLIIKKAVGARLYSIANSFNHSLTKKRITMMCKEKSKKWRCAKALYIVPVAAIAALSFSTVEATNPHNGKDNEFVANSTISGIDCVYDSTSKPDNEDPEKIYQVVEVQPEFPGGTSEMMKFLSQNIKYPVVAREAGKEGRAVVTFVVNKDGLITNTEIVKSAGDASLDAEAVRVVESMPRWKPGMQGGKAVNVRYTLPIMFRLQ